MQAKEQQSLGVVEQQVAALPTKRENFIQALAGRMGMDIKQFWGVVKGTVFKEASDAECNALLMIAHEYGLNPLLKEIYAFKAQNGGIMPMIPIDGWLTMVNRNPLFAGYETVYPPEDQWVEKGGKRVPPWIEIVMFRRDTDRPYPHREYLDECFKDTGPWRSHPKRMLKHKAFIQSARYALGYSGVYDEDEAKSMIDITPANYEAIPAAPDTSAFDKATAHITDPAFVEYLDEVARANGLTVDGVKVEAAKDMDGFLASYDDWRAKSAPQPTKPKRRSTEERIAEAQEETSQPAQQEQPQAQGEAPASVLCPNDMDEDGQPQRVYTTYCEGKACKADCPSWGAA